MALSTRNLVPLLPTSGDQSVTIGKVAAGTTVRGVTPSGTGTTSFTIGTKATSVVVRGVTPSGSGAVSVTIGSVAAGTTVRGVTPAPSGAAPVTIGKVASATAVRGVTPSGTGTATLTIGRKTTSVTVFGVTPSGSGTVSFTIGRVSSALTVRGVTVAASGSVSVPIGYVPTRFATPAIRDTFDQADGALSGSWGTVDAYTALQTYQNRLVGPSGSTGGARYLTTFPANVDVSLEVPSGVTSPSKYDLYSRIQNNGTGTACYWDLSFNEDAGTINWARQYNNAVSSTLKTVNLTIAAGWKLGMRTYTLADGDTVRVEAWVDKNDGAGWVFVDAYQESTATRTLLRNSGQVGVSLFGGGFTSTTRYADNFGAQEFTGVPVRGVTLASADQTVSIGRVASASVVRGVTPSASGSVAVSIGKVASATVVRGITLGGPTSIQVGAVGITTSPVVGGLLALSSVIVVKGAEVVRGVTLAPSANSSFAIGKVGQTYPGTGTYPGSSTYPSGAQTVVRGLTIAPTAASSVSIGRVASGVVVRGITFLGSVQNVPIGAVNITSTPVVGGLLALSSVIVVKGATTVRGITLGAAATGFSIGSVSRAYPGSSTYPGTITPGGSFTAVRGVTLVGGGQSLSIGKAASGTVVRGITLVKSFAVGRVPSTTVVYGFTSVRGVLDPVPISTGILTLQAAETTIVTLGAQSTSTLDVQPATGSALELIPTTTGSLELDPN